MRPGQHQPVVVGLVAVAVHQHDVAGGDERLRDDLVGGRGAVRDEERPPGTERLGGQLLRLAQRAGRLEQRVEAAAGGRGLGQEDVQAVEAEHVADPVGAEDGLALRDRQRVEHAGRAVAVVPQRLEERRVVPVGHPGEDAQVQFQRALLRVEHPAEVMAEMAGAVLDVDLGHQVQVEFGPQPGQPAGQDLGAFVRAPAGQVTGDAAVGEVRQAGQILRGGGGEAAADDTSLEVRVQPRGDHGFLGAAHYDQLVDKVVAGPAPAVQLLTQGVLLRRGQGLDEQHLEVRPGLPGIGLPGLILIMVDVRGQRPGAGAVGLGDQRPADPGHQEREPVIAGRGEQVPDAPVDLRAGKRPVLLDRGEGIEQPGRGRDQAAVRLARYGCARQLPARLLQPGPGIAASLPPAGKRPCRGGVDHGVAPRVMPWATLAEWPGDFPARPHPPAGPRPGQPPAGPVHRAFAPGRRLAARSVT